MLSAANVAHVVTVKHAIGGTGQILLLDALDFVMDTADSWIMVQRQGTNWQEIQRSRGADEVGQAIGQCRLIYTSATVLTMIPDNGRKLFIGGQWRTIPSGGVTVGNGGLSANTTYNIYAYMSGAAIALEAVTTARTTSSRHGHQIKSGDSTESRTLVGKCRTNGSSQFFSTSADISIINWFNRRPLIAARQVPTSGNFVSSSSSFVQITPVTPVGFLSWGDENIETEIFGDAYGTSGAAVTELAPAIDGGGTGGFLSIGSCHAASYYAPARGVNFTSYTEGWHTADASVATNGASVTIPANHVNIFVRLRG
jgi:hypothetical protein